MKSCLKVSFLLLLMLTLLLTSCGSNDAQDQTDDTLNTPTATMEEAEDIEPAANTEALDNMDQEALEEEEEEGDVDVGLLDRALLESVKYTRPDSMMAVTREEDNSGITIVTAYQRGYSTREESLHDGVTEIEIYNEDEGMSYSYTLGESTGYSSKDDEDDLLALEEMKAMEGQSLMSLFEEDFWSDMKVLADRETLNGRKAIRIEMVSTDPENASDGSLKFWFDAKYTVPLKFIWDTNDEWQSVSEVTDIEFNLKLKDDLFEAPKDVTFTEY